MKQTKQFKDVMDRIYDTLMENTQHPQFDTSRVVDAWVDVSEGNMYFDYQGKKYSLNLQEHKPLRNTSSYLS